MKPESKLRRLLLASLLLAVVMLVFYGILSFGPKLPAYQGKTLYQWATELQQTQRNYSEPNRWQAIQSAQAAIRAMGTNALPFVMADVMAQTTLKDRIVAWLAPRAR